jgi:thiamine biosynthesis protein ThiS
MFFRVQIMVNGEPQTLSPGLTIAGLIDDLALNQRRIAVEVNRQIIAREHYGARVLAEGDEVEIVHFVGGG